VPIIPGKSGQFLPICGEVGRPRKKWLRDPPSGASLYNIDGGTVTDGSPSSYGRKAWLQTHKRIARIMREDNLLTVRERWFRPPGNSLHVARVHLNLAGRMTLSGPNQLWALCAEYRKRWIYGLYLFANLLWNC